jgi:hypothetical protein
MKYSASENTHFRLNAGYGLRTANILPEYPGVMLSSKQIVMLQKPLPERAFNVGLNFNNEFRINYRRATFGFDIYHTVFMNKLVADYDTDPLRVYFYNSGSAYSDNLQAEFSYKVFKLLELKAAYKYLDVYVVRNDTKINDPFISMHRGLVSLHFESFNRKWKANLTSQLYGRKRLPPVTVHLQHTDVFPAYSRPYTLYNAQLTRVFGKFEIYAGAENIFNFRQDQHILGSDDPYGPYFDASYIWGPMDGRRIYAGFRYGIGRKAIN